MGPLIAKPKPLVLPSGVPFFSVLRIRDVYPGSRILIFTHPGSQIPDPGVAEP